MIRKCVFCLAVILLCAACSSAQSRRRRPRLTPRPNTVTDIRQVDFLNFTYHSSLCSQEFQRDGIGKTVHVHNGEFKNKEVYFGVVDNKIIYGNITGDGSEEAIIEIGCGQHIANFGLSEIFIYTLQNGSAISLAELNDNDMKRDYQRYYSDGTLWRIIDNGVTTRDGNLVIEMFAEGSHAIPQYIATFEYDWNNGMFILNKRPQRRIFKG